MAPRKPRRVSPPHLNVRDTLDDAGQPITEYRVQLGNRIVSRHYTEAEAIAALDALANSPGGPCA